MAGTRAGRRNTRTAAGAGVTCRRGRGRQVAAGAVVVVLAAGGVAAWRAGVFGPGGSPVAAAGGAPPPATAAVTRRDLSASTPVTATLGVCGLLHGDREGRRDGGGGRRCTRSITAARWCCCTAASRTGGRCRQGPPARTCPSSTTTWSASVMRTARISARWAGTTTPGRPGTGCIRWKSTWGLQPAGVAGAGLGGVRTGRAAG